MTGAAIAVIDHGNIAYQNAYGFRDKQRNLPLTIDSVMLAASITKSTFGYLVMELVDQGILNLDKFIYQYLPKLVPEYPHAPISPPTHATSGLRLACC